MVPRTIAAGATVHASLPFRLTLPQRAKDRISQDGSAIRLGSFFPLLPWEPGVGWALQPPTLANGETSSSPIADFDATIHAPAGLGVVAGGVPAGPGHWVADDVRDFGVATGHFSYVRRTVHAPGPVRLTVAVPSGVAVQADQAADEAQAAIEHLSRLYGPYPWKTLTLAYGPDLSEEGIEYPTVVFEGPDRFGLITAHEIAHQWFYSLVGNNQARDPWLDEGFASYAGAETSGDLPFFAKLPLPAPAAGHMGAPMSYWDHNQSAYFGGVYAQPVQVLQSFGSTAKVECALRRYVARNAYGSPPTLTRWPRFRPSFRTRGPCSHAPASTERGRAGVARPRIRRRRLCAIRYCRAAEDARSLAETRRIVHAKNVRADKEELRGDRP